MAKTYKVRSDGSFAEVAFPSRDEGNYKEQLTEAGYVLQFSFALTQGEGTEASVYQTTNLEDPMFFVDVWSGRERLGGLIANSFVGLLAAFRELAPLITRADFAHEIDQDVTAMVAKAGDRMLH